MGFLGTLFKKKKSSTAIKKAVAVSSVTKSPITVSRISSSPSVKRSLVSPFAYNIKADLAPLQLPNTDFTPKLTRAAYVPKKTYTPTKSIKTTTVVKTPTLDVIRPLVSQIKTAVAPAEKIILPVNTPTMNVLNESKITNTKTIMQKVQDFVKLHGIKLLIPVALLIGVIIYMKKRKPTVKRK